MTTDIQLPEIPEKTFRDDLRPPRVATGRSGYILGAHRRRGSGGMVRQNGLPTTGDGGLTVGVRLPEPDRRRRAIADRRPPMTPGPLTQAGVKLVEQYLKRSAFLDAIRWGQTVEAAGRLFLDVDRRRAFQVRDETPDGDALLAWFRDRAAAMIRDGRVRPGRATLKSPDADTFFALLWGAPGDGPLRLIDGEAADLDKILRGLKPWAAESVDYRVYSPTHSHS